MEYCEIVFSRDFMPRGECGDWLPFFAWLYTLSNVMIFAAYMTIPFVLGWAIWERKNNHLGYGMTPRQAFWARLTFATFIFFCGIGHLLDGALAFIYPMYHLYAVWHAITAVCSWAAVFVVIKIRHHLIPGV